MQKVLRGKAWVLVAMGVVVSAGGLQVGDSGLASARAAGTPSAAVTPPAEGLISPELLDHARLKPLWQQRLPVKEGESFPLMTLLGDRLYIRSSLNYLWALDRVKGSIVFSRSIAPAGIPMLGLTAYDNRLITVIGNQLVELDQDTGAERRVSDLELSIIAPVVRNNQFFYVSAADRRLHALRAKDLVQIFEVAAEDDSLITTVTADDALVAFGTDAGDLIAIQPNAPRKLWQFKVPEAISGPVLRDSDAFYFASVDTNVYRIDATSTTTSTLGWKCQTEAALDCPPVVTAGFVYQYAPGRGLTAIPKQAGKPAWRLPEGVDLLAEVGGQAYVVTKLGTLAVMDNATGHKLYAVNFAPVAYHATNTMDARIYIADKAGRVVCLEPARGLAVGAGR